MLYARRMHKLRYLGQLLGHVVRFAAENKAWWMIPLVVVLLGVGALVFAGQSATPFIYTLW